MNLIWFLLRFLDDRRARCLHRFTEWACGTLLIALINNGSRSSPIHQPTWSFIGLASVTLDLLSQFLLAGLSQEAIYNYG